MRNKVIPVTMRSDSRGTFKTQLIEFRSENIKFFFCHQARNKSERSGPPTRQQGAAGLLKQSSCPPPKRAAAVQLSC